jgi:hypothetical protein
MLGIFVPQMGPPAGGGSWFLGLVVVLGILAFNAIVVISGWQLFRSRRHAEAGRPTLPKGLPKAA